MTSLSLKSSIWPTLYTPSRKAEIEPWTRGNVRWAFSSVRTLLQEANNARANGEVCSYHCLLVSSPAIYSCSHSYPSWHTFLHPTRPKTIPRHLQSPRPRVTLGNPPPIHCATLSSMSSGKLQINMQQPRITPLPKSSKRRLRLPPRHRPTRTPATATITS